jgi:hypothetical protein
MKGRGRRRRRRRREKIKYVECERGIIQGEVI